MKKVKILAAVIAIVVLSLPITANAAANEYVYITIEKLSLGQGFILEPTRVEFSEGDTVQDLLEKVLDAEKLIIVNSQYGDYLGGIKDAETKEAQIPDFILDEIKDEELTGRAVEGELSGLDYTSQSGWFYAVNNESAMVSMGDYKLGGGDVVRFMFSVYGYGTDIGFGYDFETEKSDASYIEMPNRDDLIKAYADAVAEGMDNEKTSAAKATLSKVDAGKTEIDSSLALLKQTDIETAPETTATTPATGECMLYIAFVSLALGGLIMIKAAQKNKR